MIELFSANTPNGWKISIMLEEIGYEYKVTKVDLGKDEQFNPDFKKISPFGKIPVIVDHEHNKTICLTVQANILGVTCKKWDCVVHLWGGSSIEKWNQLSFRGGSGTHDWDVIDFAPRRAIKCLEDSIVTASAENQELLDYKKTI